MPYGMLALKNDCIGVGMSLNWYTALCFFWFVCVLYSVDANFVRQHASDWSRWNGGMTRRASPAIGERLTAIVNTY